VEVDAVISENTLGPSAETFVSSTPVGEVVDQKINSNVLQKIR